MSGKYKGQGTVSGVYDIGDLGGGVTTKSSRKINFTVDEACKFLELPEFEGDRKLKQGHVDALVRAMIRGTFHPEWVVLMTCDFDGVTYRMNGQHTAWARAEMPEDWPCKVTMTHYIASTEHDLRMLYASIDRASPRTRSNVIESYLVGSEEFNGVKAGTLRKVPQGFSFWKWASKHERGRHDGDDVAYLMKTEDYDLARKVCGFLDNQSTRDHGHVFRAPVVAAMFATFHKAPQIATSFWGPVSDGTGMAKRGDPRLKLRNELMRCAVGLGTGAQSDKRKVSQEYMFRVCITAWNAFRSGKTLQILRAHERGKRPTVK